RGPNMTVRSIVLFATLTLAACGGGAPSGGDLGQDLSVHDGANPELGVGDLGMTDAATSDAAAPYDAALPDFAGPCSHGTTRCGPTGNVEQCMNGTWAQIASCAFGCMSSMCITNVTCTPGAYHCNASSVEICNSSGTAWLFVSSCAVACSSGLCTGGCTPG